ncbi:hypothetical protein ACK3TF_001370 [Chlorella vulgaris]
MLQVSAGGAGGSSNPAVTVSSAPAGLPAVNVDSVATRLLAAAVATWQLSVVSADSNQGLRPTRLFAFGRWHYAQVPAQPQGTVAFFPGCARAARGFFPFDPSPGGCSECLGLPEELAQTKQALRRGYAVLALAPKDLKHLCWSSSSEPQQNDQAQAQSILIDFLLANGLHTKPLYVTVVSTPEARSWGIFVGDNQTLKLPVYPPTLFVGMAGDAWGVSQAPKCANLLRRNNVPSGFVISPERRFTPTGLSDRVPVVTPQQSAAIVSALQAVGILNASGWVVANPQGYNDRRSPVFGWVRDVYRLLPWMAGGSPSLNLELRTSAIFQELGVAYARHESIADYFTACLMWLETGGAGNFAQMAVAYKRTRLSLLTADTQLPPPPKPRPPPPPPKPR